MWQLLKADIAYGARWLVMCVLLSMAVPGVLAIMAGTGRFDRLGITTSTMPGLVLPSFLIGVMWSTWVYLDIRRREEGKENRFRFLGALPVSVRDIGTARLISMVLVPFAPATVAALLFLLVSPVLDLKLGDADSLRLWLASLHGFGLLLVVVMFLVPDNARNVFTVAFAVGVPVIAVLIGPTAAGAVAALLPTVPMAIALNMMALALAGFDVATFGLRRQLLNV